MTALLERNEALGRLAATTPGEPLDLLVVGGGITGAGICLDAISRGLSVGLVERGDFACGTSSKSSKLIHGGLRYLEQREFALMREACTERDLLRRLAPHLVEPIPMVLSVPDRKRRVQFGVGLWAYDALASFRNMKIHRHLSSTETEALVPALPRGKIRGGFLFYDAITDDVRLVMENLVQATAFGAVVANHAEVVNMDPGPSVCAADVSDTVSRTSFQVFARRIVVAAGVWADKLEARANEAAQPRLRPSKGIHLMFRKDALPLADTAAFIPDVERRRMLFVLPWLDAVLVGTTDTAYEGSLDFPVVEEADRNYVLDSLNATFDLGLVPEDIAGAYAGLRPLVQGRAGSTADLSRKHSIYDIAPGIIGITGGKMTTYRRMAQDATDRVARELGNNGRSKTRWIRLGSSDLERLRIDVGRRCVSLGLGEDVAHNLVRAYGDRATDVLRVAETEGATAPIAAGYVPITAEAIYAGRHEMAVHLSDLLARRTRLAITDRNAGIGEGSRGLDTLARVHGWGRADRKREMEDHRAEVERERGLAVAPPVPPRRGIGARVARASDALRRRERTG
ncbi:MAG TPA: glycerol-3-phosphate dehydrogenase/oxidase [Actinomycetota bacterium]|nr:glycerol-3-phosphate dehydrogenase/oxidase [Actinomycetota bacterium]